MNTQSNGGRGCVRERRGCVREGALFDRPLRACYIYINWLIKEARPDLGNTQSAPRGGERATVC